MFHKVAGYCRVFVKARNSYSKWTKEFSLAIINFKRADLATESRKHFDSSHKCVMQYLQIRRIAEFLKRYKNWALFLRRVKMWFYSLSIYVYNKLYK